jgi:signal transduction histidine kinase/CheY-like chemotaxis protein
MTILTQYLFFIDSTKNIFKIKPKRGIIVERSWAQELRAAFSRFISANTAISEAITSSFAKGKNQIVTIKLATSWVRVELIFLETNIPDSDQLIVSITKEDSSACKGSGQRNSEKAQEEFFADMTHEIRTSLNVILGNTRLIKTTPVAERSQLIENTIIASEQLLQLTNNYLNRFKSRELSAIPTPVTENLKNFLHTVSSPLQPLAQAIKLSFEIQIDPDLDVFAEFSPLPIAQVINNLLSNAIAHTEKGKITFQASLLTEDYMCMKVLLKVQDTGSGISKLDQSSIFNRFVQLRSNGKEGTGLGLAIVKKLAEDCGGKISVSSIPGVGSEFVFCFNVKRTTPPAIISQNLQVPIIDLHRVGKIIVIDDNPINLQVMRRQLTQLGVQADFFQSGEEAIDAMECDNYTLAFVDMSMPKMDGLLLSAHIRQFHPEMKIAVFTAGNLESKLEQINKLKIRSFLNKPNTLDELHNVLTRELIGNKAEHSLPTISTNLN